MTVFRFQHRFFADYAQLMTPLNYYSLTIQNIIDVELWMNPTSRTTNDVDQICGP